MRPINLIPPEQRRGSAGGQGRSVGGYAVLGGLAVAVVCVLAFVMTSNSLNSKSEKLARIQAESQGAKQVADVLRPYGQFADLQRARYQQVISVTTGRFDWERALHQLSLAIPRNVYLLNVAATETPEVEIEGGGSGDVSGLRDKAPGPAFAMSGCTYSQHAVARMMTRMRNLDDVTEVKLASSVRKDGAADSVGAAAASAAGQEEDLQDCVGSSRVTKFDLLVAFGGAEDAAAAAGQAGVPPGSAAPIAAAQGAVQQGSAASSEAGGTQ